MPRDPDFVAICNMAKQSVQEVEWSDFRKQADTDSDLLLIDVREDNEYQRGSIPGAIHIGKGVIERDIATFVDDKSKPLVLYCGGGSRSALAALNLKTMGYTQVMSLIGGYRGWQSIQESENR